MPTARPRFPRRAPMHAWGGRFATAALLALCGTAFAANDSEPLGGAPVDPVMRLLVEKGLVATPAATDAPLPRQLRDETADIGDRASEAVVTALAFVGVRYRRGGSDEGTGFDCSGFTRHVFAHALGLALPRRVDEQARAPGLVEVSREALKPGDLVFFNTLKRTFSHVGIYVGDNRFVHAPKPGGEVRTEDMGRAYWKARFTGARRADTVVVPAVATSGGEAPLAMR